MTESGDVRAGQTVAAIERAADVLLHFAQDPRPSLGVTDIAQDLQMSKAAVHRLLASLRTRGFVLLDEETRRYSLGPMSLALGLRALEKLDVRHMASSELRALSALTNETTTLSIRAGEGRMYVDQMTPSREVIMSVTLGVPFPLHAGASSKAFLAFLPEEEIERYLSVTLVRLTAATVTDRRRLESELRTIRSRGWASSVEERQSGAASAAAPILNHKDLPAAVISVCGPSTRFMENLDYCLDQLLQVTGRLSERLGHRVLSR
ncbi:MAG TPA: IclR family transcriptional regulator [Streptosporangiaceae bacterium]|nr:IclR family transcriptional regulator [Streptosporangiaceae bacterium]